MLSLFQRVLQPRDSMRHHHRVVRRRNSKREKSEFVFPGGLRANQNIVHGSFSGSRATWRPSQTAKAFRSWPCGMVRAASDEDRAPLLCVPSAKRETHPSEWCRKYNTIRPHSRIGWLAPAVHAARFLPQRVQGAALRNGSTAWPASTQVNDDDNRQTLVFKS